MTDSHRKMKPPTLNCQICGLRFRRGDPGSPYWCGWCDPTLPQRGRLRWAMREARIGTSALAQLLGRRPPQVSQLLGGVRSIPREMIPRLAEILGVDAAWLELGATGLPDRAYHAIGVLDRLPADERRRVAQLLSAWATDPDEEIPRDRGAASRLISTFRPPPSPPPMRSRAGVEDWIRVATVALLGVAAYDALIPGRADPGGEE